MDCDSGPTLEDTGFVGGDGVTTQSFNWHRVSIVACNYGINISDIIKAVHFLNMSLIALSCESIYIGQHSKKRLSVQLECASCNCHKSLCTTWELHVVSQFLEAILRTMKVYLLGVHMHAWKLSYYLAVQYTGNHEHMPAPQALCS